VAVWLWPHVSYVCLCLVCVVRCLFLRKLCEDGWVKKIVRILRHLLFFVRFSHHPNGQRPLIPGTDFITDRLLVLRLQAWSRIALAGVVVGTLVVHIPEVEHTALTALRRCTPIPRDFV